MEQARWRRGNKSRCVASLVKRFAISGAGFIAQVVASAQLLGVSYNLTRDNVK